jgi:resuscitation-promoting factor RpfA
VTDDEPSAAAGDDVLGALIHRADLDGLVRLVDDCCAARDWARLRRLRDEARHALGTGRQLWPAATLAEYRLALLAPAPWAAGVLDEGSGRFSVGPLTEVVAQHHTWAELAPLLEPGPRAAFVAHERVLRGEAVAASSTDGLPDVLDLPYRLGAWEPPYALATYHDDGGEFPAPQLPARPADLALPTRAAERVDDEAVDLAVRQLVEPWTTSSNGRAEVVAVEGDAPGALRALGVPSARVVPLTAAEGVAWLAWAGASGGTHGRRRGAAAGRFGALWLVAAVVDALDEWPIPLDDLGALAAELRWWWWDAHEPVTGWQVQLVVEDPTDGMAWAISARDAA